MDLNLLRNGPISTIKAFNPTPAAVPNQTSSQRGLGNTAIGADLVGKIIGVAPDGMHVVRILDLDVRMALPAWATGKPELSLHLLAKQPSLIFGLTKPEIHLSSNAYEAEISEVSSLLSKILQSNSKQPTSTLTINSGSPIVEDSVPIPSAIADALRESISKSGAFYENHLRQWINGEKTFSEIRSESLRAHPNNAIGIDTLSPSEDRLISTQASILDSDKLKWTGDAWPGQALQLEIERDETSSNRSDPTAQSATWTSRLALDLPKLGRINAAITLNGTSASISLDIDEQRSLEAFNNSKQDFHESLQFLFGPSLNIAIRKKTLDE